jgi:hypothetical protein
MVQPIEQRDVAIDLIKPAPVIMTNLLNLTHTTARGASGRARWFLGHQMNVGWWICPAVA